MSKILAYFIELGTILSHIFNSLNLKHLMLKFRKENMDILNTQSNKPSELNCKLYNI